MIGLFIDLVALFLSFYIYIFFSFPFSLSVTVYVYASLCDFLCIRLLLPFVLGFCWSVFLFSIVFSTCYHWWICLVAVFFFFNFFLNFNNFMYLLFFLSFFSTFYSEPCG